MKEFFSCEVESEDNMNDEYSIAVETIDLGPNAGRDIRPARGSDCVRITPPHSSPENKSPSSSSSSSNCDNVINHNEKKNDILIEKKIQNQRECQIVEVNRMNSTDYNYSSNEPLHSSFVKPPTAFHKALSSDKTTLKSLRVHLMSRPSACSILDCNGRLPLHLLSMNKHIYESCSTNRNDLEDFILDVYQEYPQAAVTSDNEGMLPFSYGIDSWVKDCYRYKSIQEKVDMDESLSHTDIHRACDGNACDTSIISRLFRNQRNNDDSISVFSREYRRNVYSQRNRNSSGIHSNATSPGSTNDPQPCNEESFQGNWSYMNGNYDDEIDDFLNNFKKDIIMPSYVIWSFEVLNTIYDLHLEEYVDESDKLGTSNIVIQGLLLIPNLIFLLLFTSNLPKNYSIIHNIIVSHYGIGDWIVYLMERDDTCHKAIEYLEMFEMKDNVDNAFQLIASQEFLLPTILLLNDTKNLDRVANTKVWKSIVHEGFRNELLPWIGIDLFMHLTLLICFQMYAYMFFDSTEILSNSTKATALECTCLCGILYLFLRKCNHVVSIGKICKMNKIFVRNTVRFWDVVEWITLVFSFTSVVGFHIYKYPSDQEIENILRRVLVAILGILWLNFIGFCRNVCKDMAALLERLWKVFIDIRMNLFIFTICVIAFSHMFFMSQNSRLCLLQGDDDDISLQSICTNPYLLTYSTALGMFDIIDYSSSNITIILFIVFTSIMILLLFSTLIATVYKSVQEGIVKKLDLQAGERARLLYFAHTYTLNILITSPWRLMQYCCATLFCTTVGVLFVLSIDIKRSAMTSYYGRLIVLIGFGALLFFMFISAVGFFCHLSFHDTRGKQDKKNCNVMKYIVSRLLNIIFYPFAYFVRTFVLGNNIEQWDGSVQISHVQLKSLEKHFKQVFEQERIKFLKTHKKYNKQRHYENKNLSDLSTGCQINNMLEKKLDILANDLKNIADAVMVTTNSSNMNHSSDVINHERDKDLKQGELILSPLEHHSFGEAEV